MLKITKTYDEGLIELTLDGIESGAWISLIRPTVEELLAVEKITEAPQDFVRAALDLEESSRIEIEDNQILVLINVPLNHEDRPGEYDTLPLGIIVTPDYLVTVCQEHNDVLQNFTASKYKYFCTFKRTRFLFQLLYHSAILFLKDLRQMTRKSDKIEQDLRQSMKNQELFQLLDLQKGLTYYSMSLRSNRVVVERLLRLCSNPQVNHLIKFREEDEELLDDVRVEYDQSIEMAQIQTDVLAGMMDAFASVISNNLNIVMKFLASVTIVMAIPTMIASFFGMNVPVPWSGHPLGFYIVGLLALALTVVAIGVLWKKRLF
ncbi:MAG: magnesium transporter CorA family protein [Synergistaceae bacterium]|nr:magnesium transporter CorA family protein [Synergistaceae bacterium]